MIGLKYSVLWKPHIIEDAHLRDGRLYCSEISAVVPYRASADLIGTGRVTVMKLGLVDSVRVCPLRCGSRPEYVYSGPLCEG